MFKKLRKIIKGVVFTSAAASGAYVVSAKNAFDQIFKPSKSKKFSEVGWLDEETRNLIINCEAEDLAWYEKATKQEFNVRTYDGINLSAEMIFNSKKPEFVVMSHPYNSNRFQMLRAAREFSKKGFNVVWFDQRACGKSEGEYNSMGWYEHLDLLKVIDNIVTKYSTCKIVLYGISMGGACVLKSMAEGLPNNVKVSIVEAGFTSMRDVLKKQIRSRYKVDLSSILKGVNFFTESILGFDINDFDCLDDLNNSSCATMLIHSKDDSMVEYNDSLTAYISYNGPKKLLAYENGCHGALQYQNTYFKNVFEFIDKYL